MCLHEKENGRLQQIGRKQLRTLREKILYRREKVQQYIQYRRDVTAAECATVKVLNIIYDSIFYFNIILSS
jgi:glycyl-tRNA synthetase alpha subunit